MFAIRTGRKYKARNFCLSLSSQKIQSPLTKSLMESKSPVCDKILSAAQNCSFCVSLVEVPPLTHKGPVRASFICRAGPEIPWRNWIASLCGDKIPAASLKHRTSGRVHTRCVLSTVPVRWSCALFSRATNVEPIDLCGLKPVTHPV